MDFNTSPCFENILSESWDETVLDLALQSVSSAVKMFEADDLRFMNAGLVQGTVNSIVEMIDCCMPQVHDLLVMKAADLLTILTTRITNDNSPKKVSLIDG